MTDPIEPTEDEIIQRISDFRDKMETIRDNRPPTIPAEPPRVLTSSKTFPLVPPPARNVRVEEEKQDDDNPPPPCHCNGIIVWEDSNPSGAPPKSVDLRVVLPFCAESWTYHFEPNTSADLFSVNGIVYSGCSPLFNPGGGNLPIKDGTVAVSPSGLSLHIIVQGACGDPSRRSSWLGRITCNSTQG